MTLWLASVTASIVSFSFQVKRPGPARKSAVMQRS
jgi:hypothetical protein